MSHFQMCSVNLTLKDLPEVKNIFTSLSNQYQLELVEKQMVSNLYRQEVYMLIGLKGDSIPPIGLTISNEDNLVLAVDWETNHRTSNHTLTQDVYTNLINQLSAYRMKKSIEETARLASKANINVTQKVTR